MKRSALSRKTRLRPVSAKRKAWRASDEGQAALDHMRSVKMLPCVICQAPPPSEAHHCTHGRYGTRKASDFDTIPLCQRCHADLHARKASWAADHGPDYTHLPAVRAMLEAMK